MNHFLAIVALLFVIAGIPADGILGVTLSGIGIALSVAVMIRVKRAGGRR